MWDVGKNENSEVTLISHTILDSREFYIFYSEERTIDGATVYSNNYEHSTIRTWLNGAFYNTAFITRERDAILLREVDNSAATTNSASNPYTSNNTNDKVFLLSYKDINENATTYNITLEKQGSDYAKAQGLHVTSGTSSSYLLRSPSYTFGSISCYVNFSGVIYDYLTNTTADGVVATLKIGL